LALTGFRKRTERLALFGSLLLFASALEAEIHSIPLLKKTSSGQLVSRGRLEAKTEVPVSRIFSFDAVSTRKLLSRSPRVTGALEAQAQEIAVLKVLLLRVSFETDREDRLSSISTGGDFDLTPGGESIIDPTPHDKDYFNSHMIALNNYYRFQSCGKLEITWDILPDGLDESYKLKDIADYGPGTVDLWTTDRLVAFFRETIEEADRVLSSEGYPVRFGDYDAIILAHAGANLQSDVSYDTPNDIPSFFARLGPEDQFTVDGGETVIVDGSVIPETATQDGFIGGISAVLIHEFGHQLGLPDLYNIRTNNPTVGVWDIMDSGGLVGAYIEDDEGNVQYAEGFMPTGLSAWSKVFLGWASVDTVETFSETLALSATEKCPAGVARIEASSDEYFLVENRAAELDDFPTMPLADENGVIIGMANCLNCDGGLPEVPEWELTNGYDLLLPTEFDSISHDGGPGLLIWHVDDSLIAERWEENVINTFFPFGISLLEAGGVVDLGDPYSYFWMGWYDDAYYEGNNATLSDSTMPASWSNWHVPTGVRVERISPRDTLMTLGAGIRRLRATRTNPAMQDLSPRGFVPLEGGFEALLVGGDGRIWRADGESPLYSIGAPPLSPPVLAEDFDASGDAMVVADTEGAVHVVSLEGATVPDGWPFEADTALVSHPVFARTDLGSRVFFTDMDGHLHIVSGDGLEDAASPAGPPAGDRFVGNMVLATAEDGTAERLYAISAELEPEARAWLIGWELAAGAGDLLSLVPLEGFPLSVPLAGGEIEGEVVLVGGDIDPGEPGDELYILAMDTGSLFLCGRRGIISERHREVRLTTIPALLDLNGDSYLDILYSDGRSVFAVTPSGANLTGWPRKLADVFPVTWSVTVHGAITGVSSPEGSLVVIGADFGLLYAFDGRGRIAPGFPRKVSSGFDSGIDLVPGEATGMAYVDGGYVRWRDAPADIGIDQGAWFTSWGDHSRTAYAQGSEGWIETADEWLQLASRLIVYPNPSSGDRIAFHFSAPEEGEALLEVMTTTGELVLEERKRLDGGEDEFVVSMAGKASGIYLCRLVVTSDGRSVEAYRKFAIVR
jgi:M6 family metalloprotease-like protein